MKIEHRIGVQAPAEVIWEIVADLPAWAEWNPLYPKAVGEVRIGETLDLTLALPGEAHRQIRPRVLDWVPNEQLHWKLSMAGGLVSTTRYIEIDTLDAASCIFANGELFQGLLGDQAARMKGRAIRKGFALMGEAMKSRAEAAWRARSGTPTSAP